MGDSAPVGGFLKKLPWFRTIDAPVAATAPALEPEKPSPPAPPHPELEAKLAAGDEAAWQIYADWLIEQGLSWGEVMSAALQGAPNTQRQEALERRLFGTEPRKVGWARGVMDELKYIPEGENKPPMHEVLEQALAHPAGHFVRELTLGLPPDLDLRWHLEDLARTIAKCGPLPRLTRLDMSVTSPAMDQISLRRVGDLSCIWKALPRLEELDLSMGIMGEETRAALLRHAERFKHLARLDLSDNYFTAEDQAALRAALPMVVLGEQKPFAAAGERYVSVSE